MKSKIFSLLLLSSFFFITNLKAQESLQQQVTNAITQRVELIAFTDKSIITNLENIKVMFCQNKFLVICDGKISVVKDHHLDQSLRNISSDNIKRFLSELDGFVRVQKDETGDFHLESFMRLRGGGIFGANAGFYIGKFAVYFVAHGTIAIISACTGPAAGVTYAALEGTFAAPIEAASNVVGLGTGIAAAAATGPV